MREYVVQPGDTLWHVASKTLGPNGDWRVLATLNQIPNPKQLRVGQRLKLPTPIGAATNGHSPTPAASEPQPQPVAPDAPPAPLATPTTNYVVQPGDTLRTIANKVLSPGSDWRILATLNAIDDPRQIRVGQRLQIPQRGSHPAGEPAVAVAVTETAPQTVNPVPLAATSDLGQTYVVQPGETLTTIASKVLGAGGDWRAIAELNQIADPKQVRAGQRLRIPTRS